MASPQKENGYTAIANEILEALVMSNLNGTEMSIVFTVIRSTYGFNRKEDWISYSQFEKFTGKDRANIYRCLTSLVAKMILVANKQPGKTIYSLNKDFDSWVVVKRQPVVKMRQTSCENETQVVVNRQPTKDSITKDIILKTLRELSNHQSEEFFETLIKYILVRKEIGMEDGYVQIEYLIKKSNRMSEQQVLIALGKSIQNKYKDIYTPKEEIGMGIGIQDITNL